MSTIVTRAGKGSPLTNTEVDSNFTNLNTDKVETLASADGSIIITGTGASRDLSVSQNSNASVLLEQVRNSTGATLTRGTAVYISGATGQIPTVSKALATGDATSAQTLGLITSNLANNANGYVTIIGLVSDIDTSAYTDGAQLYLSPTTAGTLTATKPYAPQHLVYVAIVAHAHPTQGKLIVKVQNGYEMDELHNVSAQSPTNGQTLVYNTTTSLWEKNTVSLTAGVNGTLPVANGGTGQTTLQNAMDALAGAVTSGSYLRGNGADVVMSAIQVADVPTLNQNTTGTAANVTGTVAIANGGTGSTTATAALTALGAYPALNPSGYTSNTGTVTGVTGTAPVVSSGGTAPAISMAAASAGVNGYMTGVYATKLDGIAAGATANTGTVTGVTGTAPVVSSGGTAPAISMAAASSGVNGYMTGTYATKLDGIATGATANTGTVTSVSGTGTVSGLTLSGTVTGAGSLTLGGAIGTLNQNTTGTAGGLTGTPNITVGTISTTGISATGDITTYRSGAPTTGVIYFGNSGARYLYYDGANYAMPGTNLYVNGIQAVTNSGTWGISITGNAATATTAANYLPLAGGTLTGNLGFSGAALFLNRNASATSGISFYSSSYTSWSMYMAAAGATSVGPTANITAPSSTYVTSWALRSFIENAAGYGWTWESGTGSGQPTVVAEIRASDGLARFGGGVVTTTGAFTGNVTVTGTGAVTLKTSGDITAYRSGGTTGVIFLNSAETRYVYWDGSNYQMPGANLQTNGYTVLNTNNYNSYALPLSGGTVSGNITFSGAVGLRITNADIRSDATSNWTGDPGAQGKIQYHANRWYIVADSSSDRIVQFRRNGTDLSYIDNSGVFQGTATSATSATSATYATTVANNSGSVGNATPLRLQHPGGGAYATSSSSVTGAIKIRMPFLVPAYGMWKLVVRIYEYGNRGNGYTIELGCHMYPNYAHNRYQWMLTTSTGGVLPVRYGNDGTYSCIWIGDNATTWLYPQIFISEFDNGYNNTSASSWQTGWVISIGTIDNSGAVDGPYTTELIASSVCTGNAATITSQANSATITAATAANANQIVLRDGSGHITGVYGFFQYLNMSHGASGATTDTVFYSSGDDYIRKNNATGFRASLNVPTRTGGDASGTWAISITGTAPTSNVLTNAGSGISASQAGTSYSNVVCVREGPSSSAPRLGFHWGGVVASSIAVESGGRIAIMNNPGSGYENLVCSAFTATSSITSSGNVTAYSDERLKTNWRDLQPNFIEQLAKVKHGIYDRIDQKATQVGVSAQSLQPVLEYAVVEEEDGTLAVAYGNAAMVSAVQLAKRVVEQDKRIARLESLINKLIGD